jgi:histidine decarboxylase
MELRDVITNAIGPWPNNCDGYGNPGVRGNGYICTVVMAVSEVSSKLYHSGSRVLDEINAFDAAEATGPYIGQINMIKASSFCGPMGGLWGYHFAVHKDIADPQRIFCFKIERHDGVEIPVYEAKPLIEASQELFGTRKNRRFTIIPGAHVPCAYKEKSMNGPCQLYCAVGIGIPENREESALLFMEDVGTIEEGVSENLIKKLMARSIIEVGQNQLVKYEKIFIHIKSLRIHNGNIGCALIAIPFLVLAKNAIPPRGPSSLVGMSLDEWKNAVQRDL